MKKLICLTVILSFIGLQNVFAQTREITGLITSAEDGLSIPGVSVIVKGTTIGTTTSFNGRYAINVPIDRKVLVFSFVGMTTQEIEINSSTIDVVLESESIDMDEVVVTGVVSGTSRKKLAFTVDKTTSADLEKAPSSNAIAALQGKIAGAKILTPATPGQSAIIQLRSATSILGSQSPLIIVDGIILDEGREGDTGLSDINAEDIESMEIVKGAAAASLYGSRAANGVIQIITKRGNEGGYLADGKSRTSVTVRNEVGFNFIDDYLPYSKSHHFQVDGSGNYALNGGDRVVEDDQIDDNPYLTNTDFQDEVFKNGFSYTNYVGISHATNTSNTFISFQNFRDKGMVEIIDGFSRQNVRLNSDFRPADNLKFSLSSMYMNSTNSKTPENVQRSIFNTVFSLEPDNDLYAINEEDGSAYNYDPNPFDSSLRNPFYNLTNRTTEEDKSRLLANISLEYKPFRWLEISTNYSIDNSESKFTDIYVKGFLNSDQGYGGGRKSDWTTLTKASNFHFNVFAHKKFGNLTAKLKMSYLHEKLERKRVQVHVRDFSTYGVTSFNSLSTNHRIRSDEEETKATNYFAIGSIDYKDKLILDGLFRRDGSSLFGENQRWHNYYRVSGAYRLTQDLKIKGVDELKFRISYGIAGLRPPWAAQYETYTFSDGGSVTKNRIGNKDLKPARAAELETGFNIDFLKSLSLNFSYSSTTVEDQFLNVPVTAATGFVRQWKNAATIKGEAYEVSLNAVILKNKDWTISAGINWDHVSNTVDKLSVSEFLVGPNDGSFIIREGSDFGTILGNRMVTSLDDLNANTISENGGTSASDFALNNEGHVILASSAGTVSESPIKYYDDEGNNVFAIANTNPDFNMSFNSTVNYKNFSLYFLWDWTKGGDLYNYTAQRRYFYGTHADVDQAGKPDGEKKPFNYYQGFYNANVLNDYFVEDGSFVKLRELSLFYTAKKIPGVDWIKELKVGVIGKNLLVFTDYSGYDPEVAIPANSQNTFDVQDASTAGAGDLTNGQQNYKFDDRGYPYSRSLVFSLQFKF